jgi:hypothetical protein
MTPRRTVFKKPVARARIESIRFPCICPVCGAEATRTAVISVALGGSQYQRPEYEPIYLPYVRRTRGINPPGVKRLVPFICDGHVGSDEGDTNYKVLCLIANAVLAVAFVLSLFFTGNHWWNGLSVDLIPLMVMSVFLISLLITKAAFRSGPLASSIKIIGFDSGYQNIWLQFSRQDYLNAFMKENAMTAELVRWIVKS